MWKQRFRICLVTSSHQLNRFLHFIFVFFLITGSLVRAQQKSSQNQNQIRQCIESVCGPASQNLSVYDSSSLQSLKATEDDKKVWITQWKPFLQTSLKWESYSKTQLYERLKKIVLEGRIPDLNATNPLYPLMVISKYLEKYENKWEDFVELENGEPYVSENALKEAIQTEPPAAQQALLAMARYYLTPLFRSSADSLLEFLTQKYPDADLKTAQIRESQRIQHDLQAIRNQYPLMPLEIFLPDSSMKALQRALQGMDLNEIDSDELLSLSETSTFYFLTLMNGPLNQALKNSQMDFNGSLNRAKAIEALTHKSMLSKSSEGLVMANCEDKVLEALSKRMTQQKSVYLQGMIVDLKAASKNVMSRLVAKELKPLIDKRINAIEFKNPEPAQQELERFSQEITTVVKTNERIANLIKTRQDTELDQFLLTFLIMDILPEATRHTLPSEINMVCQSLEGYRLTDFSLTSLGKIAISHFSAALPEIGVSVLAHEIGHVVAEAIMQEKKPSASTGFLKSRACVKSRNPYENNLRNEISHGITKRLNQENLESHERQNQDGVWTDEDWADHFSSLVLSELQRLKSQWYAPKNMACALVRDLGSYYEDKTLDPEPDDPHSSGPLRLLMMAVDRGQMTPQCQPLLKPTTNRCESR